MKMKMSFSNEGKRMYGKIWVATCCCCCLVWVENINDEISRPAIVQTYWHFYGYPLCIASKGLIYFLNDLRTRQIARWLFWIPICEHRIKFIGEKRARLLTVSKNGPNPASFSLFSSFHCSWEYTNVLYKSLPMTGFEPQTSGAGSKSSTNWSTTTAQFSLSSFGLTFFILLSNHFPLFFNRFQRPRSFVLCLLLFPTLGPLSAIECGSAFGPRIEIVVFVSPERLYVFPAWSYFHVLNQIWTFERLFYVKRGLLVFLIKL